MHITICIRIDAYKSICTRKGAAQASKVNPHVDPVKLETAVGHHTVCNSNLNHMPRMH